MACAKNYRPLNGLGQHHRVAWANCLVLAFLERIEFGLCRLVSPAFADVFVRSVTLHGLLPPRLDC